MKWTGELYSALVSDNPVQQLRHTSSRIHAVLDTTAEVLRSERDAESAIRCQISLQNIITVLSHKLEIAKSLIEKQALTPESFEWRQHILYASNASSIYNSAHKESSQQINRHLSVDYSRTNQASVRGSTTSIYSSLHSLKAGSSNALIMNNKLQGSTHSLVASSKSLLSSRNALLAATAGSDLQNSGTSSLVLFREPPPPMRCFVHCGDSILAYGFEYYGPKAKLALSPISESCILSLINELAKVAVPSLRGVPLSGKTETAFEVGRLLGRHCHQFSCSPSNKLSTLRHLITGALQSGSLLLLQDSTVLLPHVVASLGEWLASLTTAVAKAFSGKQSSIIFPVHSHQKNISDYHSDASSLSFHSTPHQSRMSVSSQTHTTDKNLSMNKASFLKDTSSRQLSVIMSEQHLLTDTASRQGTAHASQGTQNDTEPVAVKEKQSRVAAASPSQCSNVSQHSVSRTQHRLNPVQSRTATRIDWYKLGEERPEGSRSSVSKSEWLGYGGGPKINVEFLDKVFQVSPGFGCVFVGTKCVSMVYEIPKAFKSTLRSVSVIAPDCARAGEALLLSYGFTEAKTLSLRLAKVLENLRCQLASSNGKVASSVCNMVTLKQIISHSFNILTSKRESDSMDIPQVEFEAIAQAIFQHFQCQIMCQEPEETEEFEGHVNVDLEPTSWKKLNEIMAVYFPSYSPEVKGEKTTEVKTELRDAIKTQLKEHHLQDLPLFEEKIYQLHRGLQHSKCVVLCGVSGSGKTTCYRSLAGAYHYIRELRALGKQSQSTSKKAPQARSNGGISIESGNDYPCVDITVINPAIYSYNELFGCYLTPQSGSTGDVESEAQWSDGILTRLIKQLESVENLKMRIQHPDTESTTNAKRLPQELDQVNHWLVLDSLLEPGVVGALEMLACEEGLTLPNGDTLILPRNCWLIMETPKLTHFTPSLLSRSILLHFSRGILSYEAIVDTWLDRAPTQHNLSAMSTETLATMIKHLLPETLQYIHETNSQSIGALYSIWADEQVYGMTETQCFVNLLSAVLERNAPKIDSPLTHTGMSSISSRASSARVTESRASSAVFSTYSTSSMRVDSSFSSAMMPVESIHDVHETTEEADELSECSDLEAQLNLSIQIQMASMLSFAYIWSLGAFVPFSELSSFNDFARDQIMQLPFVVPLPEEGSVFDYFLNLKQYQFVPWSQRGGNTTSRSLRSSGYVSLPEVERFAYIVDLYLSYGLDVMIVGQEGTGKTSFVENLVQSRLPVTKVQMSPTLTSLQLQELILERVSQLDKRSGHRLVGGVRGGASKLASSMRSTFFLDDIQLALSMSDSGGRIGERVCSPVLELARYAIQQHQLVDFSRSYSHSLNNVHYITSCTPGEYWKLSHQLSHSFNPVPFLPPSDECLHKVFSRSVLYWLEQFPDSATGGDPEPLAKALSAASVAVFRSVSKRFHPSPSTPYLLFTMHDLLRVYEGLLLLSPDAKAKTQPQFGLLNRRGFLSSTQSGKTPQKKATHTKTKSGRRGSMVLPSLKKTGSQPALKTMRRGTISLGSNSYQTEVVSTTRMVIRLWCHESTRVYLDRTTDSRDRMWFLKMLEACIKYSFCGIDFSDPIKASPMRQPGGARRVRGGRGRVMQGPASSSSVDGPNIEELLSNGIKVDTLKQLMTKNKEDVREESIGEEGGLKKIISLDQVTLRGEDLTGLIYAQFPSKTHHPSSSVSLTEAQSSTSTEEGETTPETAGHNGGTSHVTSSYSELGDGQVMEVLERQLSSYDEERQQSGRNAESTLNPRMDLVLFKGAIEHAARLCRSMNFPGSHSLLIGAKGSGRRSLIRLVSHVLNAKLFFLKEGGSGLISSSESMRQQLRDVCISAAVDGNLTVLVINSSTDISRQDWEDIYKLMNGGLCPGLFTSSELLVMTSKMQTGRMKKTVEGAQQVFARAVSRQLHVFVLWDTDDIRGGSLFGKVMQSRPASLAMEKEEEEIHREESARLCFSSLYRACSYVDLYHPWTKQDYCDIALRWWQRGGISGSTVKWQDWINTSSHLEAVGNLAAHVHITTIELLKKSHCGCGCDLVSPRTFIECLKMTQRLAVAMKQKEKGDADKLRRALEKLNDIDCTVDELERQLATLQPRLAAAEQEVQQKMSLITAAKERYMAANERCKTAEETIERETKNMDELSKAVKEKFSEISPVYHSALEALISVQKNDILELMSYREPPEMLTPVFNALCMLFDRERTWEDCKQLLLTQNFFESLKFFDRDNVPVSKLRRLEKMIDKSSKFEDMEHASQAIVPLCTWLTALVDYHYAKMAVQPYKDRLAVAEKTLMDANKIFVEMKKDMMETRTAVENTVKLHKESVQKQRSIEFEIKGVRSKLESAKHLLMTISSQRERWDNNLKLIHSRIDSVPGHALLCSASVCYLARTPSEKHQELLTNWLGYCSGAVGLGSLAVEHGGGLQAAQSQQTFSSQQQVVKIQKDFSLSSHLSEKEELSYWKQESVFPDKVSLERCLAARSACTNGDTQWPFVFDPHQQFEKYISSMIVESAASAGSREVILPTAESAVSVKSQSAPSHHKSLLKLKLFEPNFCQKLQTSLQDGNIVLLNVDADRPHQINQPLSKEELSFISKILLREFTGDMNTDELYKIKAAQNGQSITIHSNFTLYLISNKRLEDVLQGRGSMDWLGACHCELSNFCVIDSGLSCEGMQRHLQRFIVVHERPEFKIRYKALLTDLILHQQQLADSQERVLDCVLEREDSLLQATQLRHIVKESESAESSALEQITDTQKAVRQFDQQALAYKPLSQDACIILTAIQKLSSTLKYFTFGIDKLEQLLVKLISLREDNKVPDDATSIRANVLFLKHRLLVSVYEILQVYMLRRHQVLLPLMVAMETQLRQGKMTHIECELLSSDLAGAEQQLDFKLQEKNVKRNEIPVWISRQTWCQVLELQRRVQTFENLGSEISGCSAEWKEYFNAPPYLLGYMPAYFESCMLAQKLLLWKTFQPEQLSKVCTDFVVLTVGAEVTLSQSFSVESLLPHTLPRLPTICMLPPSNMTTGNGAYGDPLSLLEETARQLKRKIFSFSLFDRGHVDELLMELPGLATEDTWVVLEHTQLYSNCKNVLQQIVQILCEVSMPEEKLHPHFRLWVLLPFEAIESDLSTECPKVAFNHIDEEGPKMDAVRSSALSEDLKLIFPSQSRAHNKWEEYEPLLSKLRSFIPPAFTYSQLTELDPQEETTESLLSILYEELCIHNSVLIRLHASLNEIFSFLKGDTLFTSRIGLALTSIRNNTVPVIWRSLLPTPLAECPELVLALNLLRCRIAFYAKVLLKGSVSSVLSVLEPVLLSNPEDVISRIFKKSTSECSYLEIQLDAKLIIGGRSLHQNTNNTQCVIFPNLYLHGARWDEKAGQLCPLGDGEHKGTIKCSLMLTQRQRTDHTENNPTTTSTIISTPTNTAGTSHPLSTATTTTSSTSAGAGMYKCPLMVVKSGKNIETTSVKFTPLLCSIPLPCTSDQEGFATATHHGADAEAASAITGYQDCAHKGQSACDYCRSSVFLSCEWPK